MGIGTTATKLDGGADTKILPLMGSGV